MVKFFKNLNFLTFWKFLNCIISTAPLCLCLGLLSFKRNWKDFLSNPVIRLFCAFALVDLCVKFYKMIASGFFERRYMLPFLCILIIFAADGLLNKLAPSLQKYLKKRFSILTLRKIIGGLISVLFMIYFIILMIPSLDHPWFTGIQTIVKQECPKGKKPILLSNYNDPRLGHYANSKVFVFSIKYFKLSNKIKTYNMKWNSDELIRGLPSGIKKFTSNIEKLGGNNVFIFLYGVTDSAFKKLFTDKNLNFPFKLLKVYHDRHNKPVCIYQFEKIGSYNKFSFENLVY